MQTTYFIIAGLTLGGALAAVSLRNLVHCALCLTVTFAGLAAFFLQLDAQFVGFAQILVYIGAVAILIVFAILLTRSGEGTAQPLAAGSWLVGVSVAMLVLGALVIATLTSSALDRPLPPRPDASVRRIGEQLMTQYVLPLEVMALLLTAALIGAVIIALQEKKR
ncbi:MAG: NADH-quinone oxidoreductase subunit J [Chloroflexi bacterium]|nr:NADH-quinone oxidoreductase subunit J [Chloroflexota bacterium]